MATNLCWAISFKCFFRQEVKDLKEIGRGNFGVVSSGKWRDTDVAVKVVIMILVVKMMMHLKTVFSYIIIINYIHITDD